ncbi:hypothetical protein SBA1_870010 [Candidatus Sulfotelmatobacter kueseliae]|uniref:Uncharacterized protein n=1 Tax=Candidatus Sulfotelmatobacter kueseliae TaxID=2042962 RepID=A0A2U3L9I2_9BACT|nr:hypothetical protein SBA1_870010 [Candidatus Sulfotelmatobacter kueseliae]
MKIRPARAVARQVLAAGGPFEPSFGLSGEVPGD